MNNALPKYSFYSNPDALHIMQIWSSHLPYLKHFSNLPSLLRSEVKILYMDLKVLHGLSPAAFPSFTPPVSHDSAFSILKHSASSHHNTSFPCLKDPTQSLQDKIGLILPLMKGPCVIFCAYLCAPDFKFKTLVSDPPCTASVLLQQQKCYYGDEYYCQNTGLYLVGCIDLMPQLISPSGGRGLLLWNEQVLNVYVSWCTV